MSYFNPAPCIYTIFLLFSSSLCIYLLFSILPSFLKSFLVVLFPFNDIKFYLLSVLYSQYTYTFAFPESPLVSFFFFCIGNHYLHMLTLPSLSVLCTRINCYFEGFNLFIFWACVVKTRSIPGRHGACQSLVVVTVFGLHTIM